MFSGEGVGWRGGGGAEGCWGLGSGEDFAWELSGHLYKRLILFEDIKI